MLNSLLKLTKNEIQIYAFQINKNFVKLTKILFMERKEKKNY